MPELWAKKDKNYPKKILKIKRFIAGFIALVMLGNYLDYLPLEDFIIQRALAQAEEAQEEATNPAENENRNQLGLIAILVEEELMGDLALRNRVMTYAENAQARIPHSKSVVLEVAKNESTYRIASLLEKMYFEGVDTDTIDLNPLNNNDLWEDDNQLLGVVLIGNVPIPVVHADDGTATASIYPYTDFYRKAYIFNHENGQFEVNGNVSAPSPEVWHGLIVPPSHDPTEAKEQLINYFDKNHEFSQGNPEFADFEKRMLYANFPEMEKQMNFLDYSNYGRYLSFMEEFAFNRHNKHLLKELIKGVSADMGSPESPIMDDATIDSMYDVHTENIFKKYAYNFAEALRIYRSGINESILKTGRWGPGEVDSPESLITLRDEYAKHQIKRKQLLLEKEVDEFVENNVNFVERQEEMVTTASLNVELEILGVTIDSNTFLFNGYFDGTPANEIIFPLQCGIQVGQQRLEGQTVLDNNSVLVKANRMYNPETLLTPPEDDDDWELEEQDAYERYGGCVFNNSIANDETETRPGKCSPAAASASIFDIVGSIEVPSEEAIELGSRCSIDRMSFIIPDLLKYIEDAVAGIVVPISVGIPMHEVLNDAYTELQGNNPNISPIAKGSYVVQRLIASGQSITYTPLDGVAVRLQVVNTTSKPIDTLYPHVEPTNETIKAIKHIGEPRVDPITGQVKFPRITTPSTPSDGIRYLSFARNSILQAFEYLNLFRVEGDNPTEILASLFGNMELKQNELNQKTGTSSDLFQDFYLANLEIIEPLIWKASSIDQKLANIIPKYLDENSFMPTPFYDPKKSPQNKPEGYEVLHIVADGDAQGYQFGLNRIMEAQAPDTEDTGQSSQALEGDEDDGGGSGSSQEEDEGEFMCGDPAGVEIWEWFDALQCWINEEILPAEKLFELSNACTAAPVPVEEDEPVGDIFDEILPAASDFDVEMKRKSLVIDQVQPITISALNADGEPVLGYIDMPVHLELDDPSLGEFSNNDFFIFSGERTIDFTAQNLGSTMMHISVGNLEKRSFEINIHDKIGAQWSASEAPSGGRSEFTISVELKDPNGADILNINDEIQLAPEEPAAGGFENSGKLKLTNGKGEIKFLPSPGKKEVTLIIKDLYITADPFIIKPSSPGATQILLRAPPYAKIGEETEIKVIAADPFGFPAESFSKSIQVELDEKSQEFADLVSSEIAMNQGKGTLVINGGGETADLKITANHEDLKKAELELPLLARVDSGEWEKTYPQNLVASFVGFPAGDFTQEDYFGGTHLFSGKTQAVYAFMNGPTPEPLAVMAPNHLVTLTNLNQDVLVEFPGNEILLQIFDRTSMQTLASKKAALNLDAVEEYGDNPPEVGKIYLDIIDDDFYSVKSGNGLEMKNSGGEAILSLQTSKVHIIDTNFKWIYQTDPEFKAIELELTDGVNTIARLLLSLKPEKLDPEDFEEINPSLKWNMVYGGTSTNDPSGLSFYEQNAELPEESRDEFYGLQGEQKYLSLFASGTNIGDAVKTKMPISAILLGDPTIKLGTKSTTSLNYNTATGQQVYEDPEGKQIASINHFNFNNDGHQDLALLTEDGRVRLLEGGPTEPPYIDKGNLAFLVDGGVALEAFDFEKDNYEDLVIATEEGRLAFLHNDQEVITRSDHKINIGKKMYKLIKADMDQDSYDDLVILDSRGDIYIFYFDGQKGKFPENGKWIANYGFSLKLDDNLRNDIDIRYAGMPEPSSGGSLPSGPDIQIPDLPKPPIEGYEGGGSVPDDAALQFFLQMFEQTKQGAENPQAVAQSTGGVPKLPWPEGDETESYFAPIESIGALNVIKKVSNKDRPSAKNVDLEETLTYTIEINPGVNLSNVVIADTVPDALTFMNDSVTCVEGGCQGMEHKQNSIKVFFSNLNLVAGQKTTISYDVFVANTPASDVLVQRVSEPNENLVPPESIIDQYLDILVSPPYNNTGKMLIHYTTSPRSYSTTETNDPKPPESSPALNDFGALMSQMEILANGDWDEDNPPPEPTFGESLGAALDDATGNNDCFEDPDSLETCAEGALDDIGSAIADFSCIGGGCFPTPFNRAFMVPSTNFPLPLFAFPTTLPTPVGPMPAPAVFGAPSLIGAASIPGPIMSQIRFYMSPTLTGGIGLAMCWGPYPTVPTVPPPVFPIPYPPPVGNCMVTALPVEAIYGPLCGVIEDGINAAIEAINAGINKVNSAVNDINNDPNLPVGVEQGGPDQGAGGLEISLAVNLGNSQKFDPPAKAFSNIHIPTFDSLGGILSGWFDRQVLEIKNKLLTLPTFTIFLPDFKTLFGLDIQKTQKRLDSWINTLSGSGAATLNSIQQIAGAPEAPGTEGETIGQKIRGGLQDVRGSKALQYVNAVETQASIYNLNALEGLYDVASTLPLVKLTEKPIRLEIPWLSAAEIQAWILEAQNWVIYYEREYNRVKDKWEQLSCEDKPDPENAGQFFKNQGECVGRHLADAFGVNFDPLINSVKENIEVLQAYLAFPKQIVKFKQQLADYIRSVACYLDIIAQMMGGWYATINQQVISWAELILTIVEIIKNIEQLFDLFINFDASCDICTNERYANFGWWMLLGLVLPDIPIIQFPKWPDIVFDISNIDAQVAIDLPVLNIRPNPLPLPPLPYIRLPDLPTISLLLTLPPLPILPRPPELPDLPELPPLPTVNLPTLPSPPKLPDIAQAFEAIIPLIEKILEIWCIMKKSFAPVPEMGLQDQIVLLTNRPAYLIPLDLLKLQLPNIAPFDLGFNEIRIETTVYLGLRVKVVAQFLEEFADGLNNGYGAWPGTRAIPKAMNQFYEDYLIEAERIVQEKLDEAGAAIDQAAADLEAGFEEYVQQALDDSLGDLSKRADDFFREKEKEFQEFADSMKIDASYEDYYSAIEDAGEAINKLICGDDDPTCNQTREDIKQWFAENKDWIQGLNYLIPAIPALEYLSEGTFGDDMQEVLDLVSEQLNYSIVAGPWVLPRLYACLKIWPYCKDHQEEFFGEGDVEASANLNVEIPKAPEILAYNPPITHSNISQIDQAKQALATPQGQEIRSLIGEMVKAINDVNNKELVDYTVLKEKFGVPDYKPIPRKTSADKLRLMRDELVEHSDQLMAEAQGLKHVRDLNAIAGVPPKSILPYQLAETHISHENEEVKVFTSALPVEDLPQIQKNPIDQQIVELEKEIERRTAQAAGEEATPPGGLGGSCKAAVCLPDPVTNNPVPVIPHIELIKNSETLFMPNGHLIYSDGTGAYLKRDLTLNDNDQNTDTGRPRRFRFNSFAQNLNVGPNPYAAVNMLQSTLTENGASTFNWEPVTHPNLYGYGIELERTITGYDSNRQANNLADTKIVLLPANEEGLAPEVNTGEGTEAISFGTLITSMTNAEEAAKKFGVSPKNIVTGMEEVRFPTINNALIKLNNNKGVYFDQLEGSAYSMAMENGYYQIKMTWFDQEARTATYNQNEILAPQIYASAAEPIDVSQTDTFYMPIYKEKQISASEILIDLAGTYQYYWFINPDSNVLTPEVGSMLNIPAQDEEMSFKVKLVATQDINDENFERFEKTFTVVVYVPSINIDAEKINEGIVTGNMSPIQPATGDDLSGIPFSIFRQRLGTWKNIGILRAEDPNKTSTNPPLGENQSYYSLNADGQYEINGFEIIDPSPVILKDHDGNLVASVSPENGTITLNDPNFDIVAVPASTDSPTHIAIIHKETEAIMGNVYYIASSTPNISIVDSELSTANVEDEGVTVGDANAADDIIAANIPDNGPSFPGGVAIFEDSKQQNVALVDKDGTIRMMQSDFKLRLKNKNSQNEPYVFQIVNSNDVPIFDIFIQADFENLALDIATQMNSLNQQIGFLGNPETAFAQEIPEVNSETETPPVPQFQFEPEEPREVEGSPFSDLDESHPFFQQILDLYKERVISGYGDGSFKPNQKLTRAEFVKIALGVTNCVDCTTPNDAIKQAYTSNPFPDVGLPSWYFYCISIAKDLGMVTGYGDGFFRPDRHISRAEAAAVLLRQSGIPLEEAPEGAFVDVPDFAWYVDYIYTAVQIGLVKENFGLVNPDEEITRGEFAFMAAGVKDLAQCRIVDTDGDGVPDWWEMTHNMNLLVPDAERACPCFDNPWPADTDSDGTRDICDLDIDNDGVINPICILTDTGQVDAGLLAAGEDELGIKADNCIFTPNPAQEDFDGDGVGDVCDEGLFCPCAGNPNLNDTDQDGIRDVCDDDIDNDGITQPICIFDDSGLLDRSKLGPEDDNCIFLANPDQLNEDANEYGDICEITDLCPEVPEDMDGVDDEDGCPELNDAFPEKDPGVYVGPGELCGFLDFATDFMEGDAFITAITDLETHDVIFSKSAEAIFKP